MSPSPETPPTIYPVILPVPEDAQALPPRERVRFLSRHARQALRRSAARSGVALGPLEKDDRGAPVPFDGTFWSLTHTRGFVGGVVAPAPVGLDIEAVRPGVKDLFRKTADEREWALSDDPDRVRVFFRYWTAKEAVLKTGGRGLADLSRCRIAAVVDSHRLRVDYGGEPWPVEQCFFGEHLASIACRGLRVEWDFDRPAEPGA